MSVPFKYSCFQIRQLCLFALRLDNLSCHTFELHVLGPEALATRGLD